MYKILKKRILAPDICLMEVSVPRVASSAQPGQFIIVRVGEKGERVPLTICDFDPKAGSVTIVTQRVGASSRKIYALEEGDSFSDFVGPLGCLPNLFMKKRRVCGAKNIYLWPEGLEQLPFIRR